MSVEIREIAARPLPVATAGEPALPIPTLKDILLARKTIDRFLTPTPLLRAEALSQRLGFELFFKCENLQPTGAFKVRGGLNFMSQLSDEGRQRGVVTASTGNHGQSIAYGARAFGVKAIVYVPEGANPLKVESMRRLGAEVAFHGVDFDASRAGAAERAEREGLVFVHAANEPALIAGVGTYALEVMEAVPDLDYFFVPGGGGSGISGACIAGKTVNPDLRVIGVQAVGAPVLYESWKRRELLEYDRAETVAEGVATRAAFELPARVFWDQIDGFRLVSDSEMRKAIVTILQETKLLVEHAGAAALAAAAGMRAELAGKRVCCVLSGGNLTFDGLRQAMDEERSW